MSVLTKSLLVSFLLLLAVLAVPSLSAADDAAAPAADQPATEAAAEGEEGTTETLVVPSVPLLDRFEQGGLTMWFLLALSVVMFTFTFERLMTLRRPNIVPDGLATDAKRAWAAGDHAAVMKACTEKPSVLSAAIQVLSEHRQLPSADASNMVGDEVSRLMRRHLQKAYPLAIVATLSPLLGLLGTVTGMIDSFEMVAIAGSLGDASLLADGISKALVTTAFGLIVSIPALGLYHVFRSRTNDMALEVEESVDDLLSVWFHAPAEEPAQESAASGDAAQA